MESQQKQSRIKAAMTAGAILGAILVAFSMITYMTNLTFNESLGYLNYFLIIGVLYFSLTNYRDKNLGGFISYKNALGFGTLVSFYGSIIIAFFVYLLFTVIDPALINENLKNIEEIYLEKGISEDQVEIMMSNPMIKSPVVNAIGSIITFTFFGFIFSLIVSAIVKKEQDPFQNDMQNIEPN